MIPLTITGASTAAAILQEPRDRAGAVGAGVNIFTRRACGSDGNG